MKAPNRPVHPTPRPARQKARRILLVDDSRAQRKVLSIQLRRAGYVVTEAASGAEALRACEAPTPDFIISDWRMPEMTGTELCRKFRNLKRDRYGFFILLTSNSDSADIAVGLDAGADDFLTKPVSGAELLARLNAGERLLRVEEELRHSNDKLRAALEELHETQDAMERDLREARKLQQGLVRERSGRFGNHELSLLLRSAGHIGGDLVGFFPIGADKVGIYALDVSGHGVTAALLAAQLSVHLSGSADQNVALRAAQSGQEAVDPATLAHFFNNMMLEEMSTDTYFTMIYAELNHVTGRISMVQAGHPHPVVQRADGRIERLGNGGMPIGLFERPVFDEISVRLGPGDRLLLTSDGLIEAVGPNDRILGEEGLDTIMRTNAFLSGHAFLESMAWSVSEHSRGQRNDDISAVLIEHRAPAETLSLKRR